MAERIIVLDVVQGIIIGGVLAFITAQIIVNACVGSCFCFRRLIRPTLGGHNAEIIYQRVAV